jgi:hypothetical protein
MGSGCLFGSKEVVRWVCASAPTGCSPRGLGGVRHPFKALNQAEWSSLVLSWSVSPLRVSALAVLVQPWGACGAPEP